MDQAPELGAPNTAEEVAGKPRSSILTPTSMTYSVSTTVNTAGANAVDGAKQAHVKAGLTIYFT